MVTWLVIQALFPSPALDSEEPTPPAAEERVVEQREPSPAYSQNKIRLPRQEEGSSKPTYYVLDTPYQQLVFTSEGGALAEINLPFQGPDHPDSIVQEIGIDRTLRAQHPEGLHFPDVQAYAPPKTPGGALLPYQPTETDYMPLLRRPLDHQEGDFPPGERALALVGRFEELENLHYEVEEFTPSRIVFVGEAAGRRITKTFSLPEDPTHSPYLFDVKIRLEGRNDQLKDLWLTTGVPEVELMGNRPAPQLKVRTKLAGGNDVEKLALPKEGERIAVSSTHTSWISNSNGFFGIILNPIGSAENSRGYRAEWISPTDAPSRLSALDESRYQEKQLAGYEGFLPLPAQEGEFSFHVFAGPYSAPLLKKIDKAVASTDGSSPDFVEALSFRGIFGFIAKPFAQLLFVVMQFFHMVTHSWAFSIILLTVVLRLALFPLSSWSMRSMRRLQELQPEVRAIQARHKKNPKKAQQETMALYKKRKCNPLSGCLPIIIQMPFLVAMFDLLKSTFALRGASFIPGWIDNLTAPDHLLTLPFSLPLLGAELHLLPLLVGAALWLQQKLSSRLPKDRSQWTDQQRQQRMMGVMMAFVFTFMFYQLPSGLSLYFLSSTLLGMVQQWWINRQLGGQKSSSFPPPSASSLPQKKQKKRKPATGQAT